MKRIFTFLVAVFMAVCANASVMADEVMAGAEYSYGGTWAGNWFNQGDMNKDVSEYDYVYIKFSGVTGKVNFVITGMHFGMKRAKLYPAGMHIISVPYQKFPDFFEGLTEMEWDLPALSEEDEVQAMVHRYYDKFDKAHDKEFLVDPSDRGRNA